MKVPSMEARSLLQTAYAREEHPRHHRRQPYHVSPVFDVCVIPRTTPARILAQLIKVMLDVPGCRDELDLYRGRHVRVRVNRRKPQDVRILDGALALLIPAGSFDRLRARQVAAQANAPVIRPAPRERVASERASAAARGFLARSTPPGVVA